MKHSWRYYRNFGLTWIFLFTVIVLGMISPRSWWTVAWAIPAVFLAYYLFSLYRSVHPSRLLAYFGMTPKATDLEYEEIVFRSRDGLRLCGWFVQRGNGATIILAHGLSGSCSSMIFHAALLAKDGYSVLMLDLRAHGSSQGDTSTFGILEANDILGAVDYLLTRPGVDPGKIGALGISLGAQAVLRAANQTDRLKAIVLEGLGSMSLADHGGRPTTLRRWINYPINWFLYTLGDWMTGIRNPESTSSVLAKVKSVKMLISCGRKMEQYFNRRFYDAARQPKVLWEIPKAVHAGGYVQDPKVYKEKVCRFFGQYLFANASLTE